MIKATYIKEMTASTSGRRISMSSSSSASSQWQMRVAEGLDH